jgi:putative methyltransferase (TIGR04325 family)
MNQAPARLIRWVKFFIKIAIGRLRYYLKLYCRFHGAFESHSQAINAVPSNMVAGYNHHSVVETNFDKMCEIAPWDYPVLFWLERILPETNIILDAGGHMGTKYRAFRRHLNLDNRQLEWIIYDLPAIVQAGHKRACEEGLTALKFVDNLSSIECPDVMIASGLLQYLDIPFKSLIKSMKNIPRHFILNKVAMWEERDMFTLENFGNAFVPYQIRNKKTFLNEIEEIGLRIIDEWEIPSLSHVIPSHPELGRSVSKGYYLTLEQDVNEV